MFLPALVRFLSWTSANFLPALDSSGKISNKGYLLMTRTNLFRDSANWWLVDFILDSPWSCLSSFNSGPEQVPKFYPPSTVRERNQTKIVSWWHWQWCPETWPTDGLWILFRIYHGLAWACSTVVLNKCQYFTGSRQFRKNIKPRLLSDDKNNFVRRFRQQMTTRILLWIFQYFN